MTQKQTSSPTPTSTLDTIIVQKRLTGTWTLAELTEILRQLNEYQTALGEKAAKLRQQSKRGFIIGVSAFIGTLFLGGVITAMIAEYFSNQIINIIVMAAMFGAFLVEFAIIGNAIKERFARRKVEKLFLCQEFVTYCHALLMNLNDDVKRGNMLAIDLLLDPIQQKQYAIERSAKYAQGSYHTCYDYPFERTFLTMTARLADGNRLKLACREVLIETKRTKRSASGKTKTKTKYKKRITCKMFVQIAAERFACQELPPDREYHTFELRGKTVLAGKFKEKSKGSPTAMPLTPQATLTNLLGLYGCIRAKEVA